MEGNLFEQMLHSVSSADRRYVRKQADLALRIDSLRRRKAFTKKAFAVALGVPPSYVSRLLSGRANPTLRTITKIEDVLREDVMPVTTDEAHCWSRVIPSFTNAVIEGVEIARVQQSEVTRLDMPASFESADFDAIVLS